MGDEGLGALPVALSVVVPARDEGPNLARLLHEVHAALDPTGLAWELVVVDDGSIDRTAALLGELAATDPRLRPLRAEHPSGQTAALGLGFAAARGRYIATLDADLQCSPADIPTLLERLEDADLACGIRATRVDPPSRRLASWLANLARRALLAPAIRDLACPLRVFRASALARIAAITPLFDGAHRWLPALFVLAGLRVVQRSVAHHPRLAGRSKYTTRRRIRPILREIGVVVPLALARSRRARAIAALGLLLVASMLFLYGLGRWPLIEPDEGRNAEIAREMLVHGQWSVPHLNGLPYLDKPILLFWLIAGAFRLAGTQELAARLPSALAALATLVLTYDLGQVLLGRRRALLAATILATTPMVLAYGRLVIFDMVLTAFVTAALCCLVRARVEGNAWRWLPLAGLAMGLAMLTKGPVGIAVPLLAFAAGRSALPRPRRSGMAPVVAAVAVVLAVVVPWLVVTERQEPGFLRYALLDETFLRLTSPGRFHRAGPVYFYAETLAWALGAWGLVLAALSPGLLRRWRAGGDDARAITFAARAAAAVVVFFTLSASKRPHYILPALVPLALITAAGIASDANRTMVAIRAFARWAALGGVLAVLAPFAGFAGGAGEFVVLSPAVLTAAGLFLVAWGLATLLAGRKPALAVACCALFAPGLGVALLKPLTTYAEARSSKTLAAHVEAGARVVCFDTFRQALPFYLGRSIVLASDNARALTSNYVNAQRHRLIGSDTLVPIRSLRGLLDGDDDVYIVAGRRNAERLTRLSSRPLAVLYADQSSILFHLRD